MYDSFNDVLYQTAASTLDPSLQDFENTFAPVPPPPNTQELQLLLDIIGIGAALVFAPFFDLCKWLHSITI